MYDEAFVSVGPGQAEYMDTIVDQTTPAESLQWRHNERDVVSNHWRLDCLLSRLFRLQAQIKENIKAPRHWPLWGKSTGDRWIPLQRASTAKMFPFDDVITIVSLFLSCATQTLHVTHLLNLLDIRCANMKWIRWVFFKIQSEHDSVHRRTDGQTDGQTDRGTRWNQYTPFQLRWSGGIITSYGRQGPGGRLNKKDGLTRYGDSSPWASGVGRYHLGWIILTAIFG